MPCAVDATETAGFSVAGDAGKGRCGEGGGVAEALVGAAEVARDGGDGVGGQRRRDAEALGVANGGVAEYARCGFGGENGCIAEALVCCAGQVEGGSSSGGGGGSGVGGIGGKCRGVAEPFGALE